MPTVTDDLVNAVGGGGGGGGGGGTNTGTPAPVTAPTSSTPTPGGLSTPTSAPPEPRFNYFHLNVSSTNALTQYIVINEQLPLFQTNPQLKTFVRPAVERAVQEWIHPVVERSVKIAITTSEQVVKKVNVNILLSVYILLYSILSSWLYYL